MIDEGFFRSRLGDLFQYSVVPYSQGSGVIRSEGGPYECEWALNVSPCGECLVALSVPNQIQGLPPGRGRVFPQVALEGLTTDGLWQITSNRLIPSKMALLPDFSFLYVMRPSSTALTSTSNGDFTIDKVRALLTNFRFDGLEVSQYPGRLALDRFTVPASGCAAVFCPVEHQSELLALLEDGRVDRALLSSLTVQVPEDGLEPVHELVSTLCSLLTFANLTLVNDQVREYYQAGNLVRVVANNFISSPYNANVLIDNSRVEGGVRAFLEECLPKFAELDSELNLRRFIRGCVGMDEGLYTDNRVAALIMLLEYLVTKWLGIFHEPIGRQDSIQSKLGKLNKHVRFIPRDYHGEDLRTLLRNPLFHVGEAEIGEPLELFRLYSKYADLLIRLFLRMIGYTGKFISRQTWEPVGV